MANSELTTSEVRDQFAAYVDPRKDDDRDYNEFGEMFDAWLETVKAEERNAIRAETRERIPSNIDLEKLRQTAEILAKHEPDMKDIHEYLDALKIMQRMLSGTAVLALLDCIDA